PRAIGAPTASAVKPAPRAVSGRYSRASSRAASRPNPATGWPRRGSGISVSSRTPRASPPARAREGPGGRIVIPGSSPVLPDLLPDRFPDLLPDVLGHPAPWRTAVRYSNPPEHRGTPREHADG